MGARLSPEIIGAITLFTHPAPIRRSISRPADAAPTTVSPFTPLRMSARMIGIGWLELRKPPTETVMPSRMKLAASCSPMMTSRRFEAGMPGDPAIEGRKTDPCETRRQAGHATGRPDANALPRSVERNIRALAHRAREYSQSVGEIKCRACALGRRIGLNGRLGQPSFVR